MVTKKVIFAQDFREENRVKEYGNYLLCWGFLASDFVSGMMLGK